MNPLTQKFAEMLAIEAEFGSLFEEEDEEQEEVHPSNWGLFFEAISRKGKFSKLKDCINMAKKEKALV